MVNDSLTPKALPHNATAQLAALLERNFQYHRKQQTLFHPNYLFYLKTGVGLAFTAILVDGLYVPTHRPDLNRFLDYFSRRDQQTCLAPIALAAARILDTGAQIFRRQDPCSDYYPAFAKALKRVVQSGLLDSAQKEKIAQQCLQKMLRSSLF